MKKSILILLIAFLLFGCLNKPENKLEEESSTEPSKKNVPTKEITNIIPVKKYKTIIGTWKLNYEKSILNQYTDDKKIELTTTTLLKDGSTESSKWIWPKERGVAKCISRKIPENMLYVEIVVEPGHWYVPIMRDGGKVSMYHKTVSKDGKTLTQTLKGLGRDDNPGSDRL